MADINGTVVAIQGRTVDSAAPADGDMLVWDASASKWKPGTPSPQAGGLESWVGTANSQQKVLRQIPFTARTTGTTWVSTGLTFTAPASGTAVALTIRMTGREVSPTANGTLSGVYFAVISNTGGTYASDYTTHGATFVPTSWSAAGARFSLTTSSGTTTLNISTSNTATVDWQGIIDFSHV